MISPKRIAVIGAGPSGLAAIKSCKEEGLVVTCYEKTDSIGGRWRFRENSIPGVASVMKTTISISSKEMGAFSDFPPPKDFPNYLHHTKMLEYLKLYTEKFDLISAIRFRQEVIRIDESLDHEDTGKWQVTTVDQIHRAEVTEEFDGIMICTGRLSYPYLPTFSNQENFTGKIIHSHFLKDAKNYENMNVLIVGNGNSAVDAAVEISIVVNQVYLSTEKGFWLTPKLGTSGFPFDMCLLRRNLHMLKKISPNAVNKYVEKYMETKINHEAYKIKPQHRALDKHLTVNDDLPDKILTGRVCIKGAISRFVKNGVVFQFEEDETKIDAVVFATGYEMKLPFLQNKFYRTADGDLNLYKNVFPVTMKHPTLALIGFVESHGPLTPISESQTRWASRVMAKKLKFPNDSVITAYIKSKFVENKTNDLMVDYIQYMDDLANEYGAKPNMPALLFKDSRVFWICLTGPLLPYQYRLVGPHTWDGARSAIVECHDRVTAPFDTRETRLSETIMAEKIAS